MDGLNQERLQAIDKILEAQSKYLSTGSTSTVEARVQSLKRLRKAILNNRLRILGALKADLNKSFFEGEATEVSIVLQEISFMLSHLKKLNGAKTVPMSLLHFPSYAKVLREPLGRVLVISPWNYPFQLAMMPLIGAIAGGNTVVLRPSRLTPYTIQVMSDIIDEAFTSDHVSLVEGDSSITSYIIDKGMDHIFFTGSTQTGSVIMERAARQLTPVTLELGGKSPCIVDETASFTVAAQRIIWGKLINSGQTCVAPDYILVHRDSRERLIGELKRAIIKFFGENPMENPQYPKIISESHFQRLLELMKGGEIIYGGGFNCEERKIEPTIVINPDMSSPLMEEEIFGPILPIVIYEDITEAVDFINSRPKPLALYLFSTNKNRQSFVLKRTSFGGGCVNDTLIHLTSHRLPFGGVGKSGMGSYHGRASLETFTHKKAVVFKGSWLDLPMRYAPYKDSILKLLQLLNR